jgi:glucose-1-phosphate adenylyltransferase
MYRLIDVPISNCINSGINRIFVLTQFLSTSLHAHIRRTYNFDHFNGGYVEVLAAQETISTGTDWYQGTADAVRKNLVHIDREEFDFVLILSGDQLYRMDFRQLINTHRRSGADVTISCMPVDREAAKGFGIMQLDDTGRVRGFVEKPQSDESLERVQTDPAWIDARGIPSNGRNFLASMGIYVFDRQLLSRILTTTDYADFGREVFPATIATHLVQTHLFDGYWEDIGTIKSFYDANISLASEDPHFRLFTPEAPIFTRARFLPPSKISGAAINKSLIAHGCKIGMGSHIEHSVVGLRTIVGANVTIRNSIIMGADFYETDRTRLSKYGGQAIAMGIGDNSTIEGAIIDKNCRIGENVMIISNPEIQDTRQDHPVCVVRDGIPVIIKDSEIGNGMTLRKILERN